MTKDTTRIYEVTAITGLAWTRKLPPDLLVSAAGITRSTGYSNPRLIARTYVTPPADGVLELDFVADPPTGIVLYVQCPVEANVMVPDLPDWVRGVRIVAETNVVDQMFPEPLELPQPPDGEATEDDARLIGEASDGSAAQSLLLDEEEGFVLRQTEGSRCTDFLLVSTHIPEVKTEWRIKCVVKDPFSGKCLVKTKVPQLFRRTSKLRLMARVCVPDGNDIWDEVRDCIEQAIAAGLLASLVSGGNLAVGAAVLKKYLLACLKSKLGDLILDIDVDLRREKIAGPWKPV